MILVGAGGECSEPVLSTQYAGLLLMVRGHKVWLRRVYIFVGYPSRSCMPLMTDMKWRVLKLSRWRGLGCSLNSAKYQNPVPSLPIRLLGKSFDVYLGGIP